MGSVAVDGSRRCKSAKYEYKQRGREQHSEVERNVGAMETSSEDAEGIMKIFISFVAELLPRP